MSKKQLLKNKNLLIIFGVTLMAVMGVAVISPALPTIKENLNIPTNQIGLLITFFTLPSAIMIPIVGVMADRFGRKKILIPSLFIFAIAGTACAFTSNFSLLLGLRVLQGIGAASLGSINMTIIGDLFNDKERVAAMGLNASVLSVGVAAYPLLGGTLAGIGWNYPFLLSAIALPIGILAVFFLKNPEPRNTESILDYLKGTWSYLKNLKVAGLFSAGMISFVIMYGAYLVYFGIMMKEKFDASPFVIGIIMSVASLGNAVMASQLDRIHKRFSLPTIIKISFSVYAVAMFITPFMPDMWLLLIPAIISGMANGATLPSVQNAVSGLAPMEYRGAFMSLNNMMLRIGQTIGPPLIGLFYYFGIDATFFAAAGISLLVPIVAILFGFAARSRKPAVSE